MDISRIEKFSSFSTGERNLKVTEYSDNADKKHDEVVTKVKTKSEISELNLAVDKANKVLFKNNTHLQFRVHEKTNEVMVKIIDDVTGDVVKEIPPEKMLDLVAKLWEIAGIIVDEKA